MKESLQKRTKRTKRQGYSAEALTFGDGTQGLVVPFLILGRL